MCSVNNVCTSCFIRCTCFLEAVLPAHTAACCAVNPSFALLHRTVNLFCVSLAKCARFCNASHGPHMACGSPQPMGKAWGHYGEGCEQVAVLLRSLTNIQLISTAGIAPEDLAHCLECACPGLAKLGDYTCIDVVPSHVRTNDSSILASLICA